MKKSIKVILLAAFFALSGCSSTPKPPPTPSSLASISISPEIYVLAKPELKNGGDAINKVLTKLGSDWPEERRREFQQLVEPVNIQALVQTSVRKNLANMVLPMPVLPDNAEAIIKFSVEEYGFDHTLEGLRMPSMQLKAELVKSDGHVIWDDSESIDRHDQFKEGVNVRSWSDYENNAALMSSDFSSAIDILVKEIFEKLKKDYLSGDIEN